MKNNRRHSMKLLKRRSKTYYVRAFGYGGGPFTMEVFADRKRRKLIARKESER